MTPSIKPPRLASQLFEWYCENASIEDLHGDMEELFYANLEKMSARMAKLKYWQQVFSLMFSYGIKKRKKKSAYHPYSYPSNHLTMIKNYFKIGWRNLSRNNGYSFLNIFGLTVGMCVTLLIGMWVLDELSYNTHHQNYNRIAQVYQHQTVSTKPSVHEINTVSSTPIALAAELKSLYKNEFKHVVKMWWEGTHTLMVGENKIPREGTFIDKEALEMFSFNMIKGSWKSLDDPASIVLSEASARILFGDADPINQLVRIDNFVDVKVTGVFKEMPANSQFHSLAFLSTWDLWVSSNEWMEADENNWNSDIVTFVEIQPGRTFGAISSQIEKIKFNHIPHEQATQENPTLFLHPMSRWHLYSEWKNGHEVGGRIQLVGLFGITGFFVLLLACINFTNLSTAQSQMRAKEIGVRKSMGSFRSQLIFQFFTEVFLTVAIAFLLAIGTATLILPWFNELADKNMEMPWTNSSFLMVCVGFIVLTSILAGSYPALYLSSFQPVKVLKGTFKAGRFTHLPRRILVVLQFSVSIVLIIGTITVWRQIQFAKNRPVGYTREGLILVRKTSPDLFGKFRPLRNKLKAADAIVEMADSSSPTTATWEISSEFSWSGKDPNTKLDFAWVGMTHGYGETMGWEFVKGRDLSRESATDSSGIVINESALKVIGWENPIDEEIMWRNKKYKVLGVIKDMIVDSPYEPVKQTMFLINEGNVWINIRLNPELNTHEAIYRVENVFKALFPAVPFDYKFADLEYSKKFASEERVGKLASLFAVLAIFISCLGLFGLASYMAQQRTKEIGIRKVMGASTFHLWKMLSKDFVLLVIVSLVISAPIGYYFMNDWLQNYSYRIEISWWVFTAAGTSALVITLLTVSYQSIKAALANPVNSLRSE